MSPEPLIPANLKELSLLRKVAKKLGLKRTASGDQVLRELQRQVALKVAAQQAAEARGTLLPPPPDLARLRAALDEVVSLRPVAHGTSGARPPAVALPEPMQALRKARAAPAATGNDEAAAGDR